MKMGERYEICGRCNGTGMAITVIGGNELVLQEEECPRCGGAGALCRPTISHNPPPSEIFEDGELAALSTMITNESDPAHGLEPGDFVSTGDWQSTGRLGGIVITRSERESVCAKCEGRRFIMFGVYNDEGVPIDLDSSVCPLCSGTGKHLHTLVDAPYLRDLSRFEGAGDPSLSFASN